MDILSSRQQMIVNILNEREEIAVQELADLLEVTSATIRRELTLLAEKGIVIRKHGYACLNNHPAKDRSVFGIRLALHREEKLLIAQRAIQYLSVEDSSIILDSGTTTYAMAELLAKSKEDRRLSVITNGVPIVSCCPGNTNMICGGFVEEASLAVVGHTAEAYFDTILADVAFIGANGVLISEGPTVSSPFHMEIKRKMMSRAGRSLILIDPYKFKARGISKLCSFKDIYALITIRTDFNSEQIDFLRKEGIRVDCANEAIYDI